MISLEQRLRQDRLQKFARIISGNYKLRLNVTRKFPHPGACVYDMDKNGNKTGRSVIIIQSKLSHDKKRNLVLQKAVTLHEMGHELFTESMLWRNASVDKELGNLIEDGRVEEAVSRLFPKARTYFYMANKELNKRPSSKMPPRYIHQLIIREAKRTTGIPQLTAEQHQKIKDRIGEDNYNTILQKTRLAVEAETEKEAIRITTEIKDILMDMQKSARGNAPTNDSLHESGDAKLDMPNIARDKILKEILEKTKDLGDILPDVEGADEPDANEPESEIETEETEYDDSEQINVNQPQPESLLDDVEKEIEKEVEDEVAEETAISSSSVAIRNFDSYGKKVTSVNNSMNKKPISVGPLQNSAKAVAYSLRLIAEKGRKGWRNNQTSGRLYMKGVISSVANNNARVFKSRVKPEATDLSAVILIDASGSMRGAQSRRATETSYIISKAMELNKFQTEVVQFGIGISLSGIKSFNQKMKYAEPDFIPQSDGSTPLLPALEGAEKSISNIRSKRKVVFVVTDGQPNNTSGCKNKVKELEAEGIIVVGILINAYDNHNIFKHKMSCNNIIELQGKMQTVLKNVLRTIKRS